MPTLPAPIDLERLLKLRLVVGRFGEMGQAAGVSDWWNTNGLLGPSGAKALRRGFARTHRFAQARAVFAVAAHRCSEVFEPPGCVTLWRLPDAIEEEFTARWEHWLDHAKDWEPFFVEVERIQRGADLVATLQRLGLVSDRDLAAYARLRRSSEGRSVPLTSLFSHSDDDIALLALGFARGEPGAVNLVVPYARLGAE